MDVKSMLIVDDHPAFRQMAARLMTRSGYDVVGQAADGAEAIRQARALRPDVLLLDVQLPDIDGFAVAAALQDQAVDVVLVSARDAAEYGTQVATCGCRGFISKAKLTPEALEALIASPA